ncbi:MAG: CapA family protein [Deltaproteobacteria bacterium]|nr:CapA family protein [Deltaproteobacteria bacterium]
MNKGTITIAAVGDVMIDRDNPESAVSLARKSLQEADLSFCQLETSYSDKGSQSSSGPRGAMANNLRNYVAIPAAGFNIVSMASNHAMDWGKDALIDCRDRLRRDGISPVGAGSEIAEAREPSVLECNGTRIAFLSYCSVAPKGYYASKGKPGVAPMRAITHYEPLEDDQPGTPCEILTYPVEEDLADLLRDIKETRKKADVVALSLHWGIHYFRAAIAGYQPVVARAAIDAGADVILGHHPHMLKGVDVYKGKVILYSLGNFAFDSRPRAVDALWYARRRKVYEGLLKLAGHDESPAYRSQPESRNSMIARIRIADKRIQRVSIVPVLINNQAQPEPLSASEEKGRDVIQYLRDITEEAGLNGALTMSGDEAVVGEGESLDRAKQ